MTPQEIKTKTWLRLERLAIEGQSHIHNGWKIEFEDINGDIEAVMTSTMGTLIVRLRYSNDAANPAWQIAANAIGIQDRPQDESNSTDLFDCQLRELMAAVGWQGGTYHQLLAEVKRLKSLQTAKEPKAP